MKNETNIHEKTIINKAWNEPARRIDFSFVFAFQNKEQYLDFRRLWKQNYSTLGATIRAQKALIKATMRRQEYAGKLQAATCRLSGDATIQLLMLRAAKLESNRQYLALKQMAK